MLIPIDIKLSNFLCHKDTIYTFNPNVVTVVYGHNKTNKGQKSNGSGKTALFLDAILFALIGETVSDRSSDDLITYDCDSANVQLSLLGNNMVLTISRTIFAVKSKASKLYIELNGEEHKIVSIADGNNFILSKLGLTRSELINYFILSKNNYTALFNLSDNEKKSFISKLCGSDIVNGYDKLIKADIDKCIADKNILTNTISKIQGEIAALQRQFDKLNSFVSADRTALLTEIDVLNTKIQQCDIDEKSCLDRITQYSAALAIEINTQSLDSKIDKFKAAKIDQLKQEAQYKGLLGTLQTDLSFYEKSLIHSTECPNCNHKFNLNNKQLDLNLIESGKKDTQQQLQQTNESLNKIKLNIEYIDEQISKFSTQKIGLVNAAATNTKNLSMAERSRNDILNTKSTYKNNIKLIKIQLDNINEQIKTNVRDKKQIEKQIQDCNQRIIDIQSQVEIIDYEIDRLNSYIILVKKFLSDLTSQYIDVVENLTNKYLDILDSDIEISLSDFNQTKAGHIRDKISVSIIRNGENIGSYKRLSSGEKIRIDVCCVLAQNELINSHYEGKGLDLLILDEIIESVDDEGALNIIKALNNTQKTICVITHAGTINSYENTVTIIKDKNIAYIQN